MKTKLLLLSTVLTFAFSFSHAQTEFWGVLPGDGGESTNGAIYNTKGDGTNLQLKHIFSNSAGQSPEYTKLCEANNGKLYGLTSSGGIGNGVIFEFDTITEDYTIKFEFDNDKGIAPYGSLVKAPNGLLYGLTSGGGANSSGVLFEYNPYKNRYKKVFDFYSSFGANPYGSLTLANNGKLYGMTNSGGSGSGILFEFDIKTGIVNKKFDFAGLSGINPYGDLMLAQSGKLYGMTYGGGVSSSGVLFEYTAGDDTIYVKVEFDGSTGGGFPYGSLMQTSGGNIYGMTSAGGTGYGVVFEYDGNVTNTIKFSFPPSENASAPTGTLMEDSNGKLYGLAPEGGFDNVGALFEFLPGSDTCEVRKSFTILQNDANNPHGSLMMASNNRIYGLTFEGGSNGGGILFEYDATNESVIKKVELNTSAGTTPSAALLNASNGKLYGLNRSGGKHLDGTLYEYDPSTQNYKDVHHFLYDLTGAEPYGELLEANNGKIYGTTSVGGADDGGTLFEYDPGNSSFAVKHDFDTATGIKPLGGLIEITDTLYGMTSAGGTNQLYGVIFEYAISTNNYVVKHDFDYTNDGANPEGKLLLAKNGYFYGLTSTGGSGSGFGTLFKFDRVNEIFTPEEVFYGVSGSYPYGSLIQANDTIYGLTSSGGYCCGTMFKYNIDTEVFTGLLIDFNDDLGVSTPVGDLVEGANNKLYGVTSGGGIGNGILFEYDIVGELPTFKSNIISGNLSPNSSLTKVGCYTVNKTVEAHICKGESYDLGTQTLTAEGTYTETFTSVNGCDSVVTLNLMVSCPSKAEFWSTTLSGGDNSVGTIYKIDENGENHTLEYSFATGDSGNSPYGGLIQARNGKLYGMTSLGGTSNNGVIYEFNPALNAYTNVFNFNGSGNGANPKGEFVEAPNGLLYGMTSKGGSKDAGVLFEFNPATNAVTKTLPFDSLATGANPSGALLLVNDSLMYGVTSKGGANTYGVLFEYNFVKGTLDKKFDFEQYGPGAEPLIGLMQANNGRLYGVSSKGGMYNNGYLFEYIIGEDTYSTSYEFYDNFMYGEKPTGKLVQANNGMLYGVAELGGSIYRGSLFEYDFSTNTPALKVSFDSTSNGQNPMGSMVLTPSGNLLGTTSNGLTNNNGGIFEYIMDSSIIHTRHNFNGTNGAHPQYASLTWVKKYPIYDTINNIICSGDTVFHGSQILTNAGSYSELFTAVNGLDSTVTMNLIVNPVFNETISASICKGDNYIFGSQVLDSTGQFTEVFSSLTGCDSTVVLNLLVSPLYNEVLNASICQGTTYPFGAQTLSTPGVYVDSLIAIGGCDSVVTLNLAVDTVYTDTLYQSICQGDSIILGTQVLDTIGQFKEVFTSLTGCDSVIVMNVDFKPVYYAADSISICAGDTYIFGAQTLSASGQYVEVFTSVLGCDSTVTLKLKVDSVPGKPNLPQGKTLVDNSVDSTMYKISKMNNAVSYIWNILPNIAGNILQDSVNTRVIWNKAFSGLAKITVKGVNNCGVGVASDTLLINVTANPVADFTCAINGLEVVFTNQSRNGNVFNWRFGDGAIGKKLNAKHLYRKPGYYKVCLKTINFVTARAADTCIEILVGDPATLCRADFKYTVLGDTVRLVNTSVGNATDIQWDFGDGTYSITDDTAHIFAKPDFYEITLTTYNSETNCISEVTKIVRVVFNNADLCNAQFSYYTNDSLVTFENETLGEITNYFWDFGDGKYSFKENPEHVYLEPGYFEVNLTTYDSVNKCLDNTSEVIFVYYKEATFCNAKFKHYSQGLTVSFTSEAAGDFSRHFWNFNDGSNSNAENPIHTYAKPGYYEVRYSIIDTTNGCFDSFSKIIFVEGTGGVGSASNQLKPKYSYFPNSKNYEIKFKDKSLGTITKWYWDFGDNSKADTLQHPVYTYATNDYYRACLTASNEVNQKTKCKFIAVGDVSNSSTAYFNYFADTATSTGHFRDKSLGNITSRHWDFGDGSDGSSEKNPSHTYAEKGYYGVCLTTTSEAGISKTWCENVRIDNSIENPCLFSCVWPGDANYDLEANHYDIMTIGLNYGLEGPKRDSASIGWYGQFAQNWSTYQIDGTNNKHGDCNGDGLINIEDIEAIKQNFAYSYFPRQPDVKNAEMEISCVWVEEGSKRAGSRSRAKGQLSPPAKSKKPGSIYAIGFEIEVIGGYKIDWDSVEVNFDNSWIGKEGVTMLTVTQINASKHTINFGITRIDQNNVEGSGEIVEISFKFKDDVDESGVSFNVTTEGGIEATGYPVTVDGNIEFVLNSPLEICEGETGLIDAGSGFDTYTWSTGVKDTSILEVSAAGYYGITVTDVNGALAIDSVEVIVHEVPSIDLGADISQSEDVELDAGAGFASYLWSTNEEGQNITVTESGEYWVSVTNNFGCSSVDTISVTITTGINGNLINDIAVFPNPNNGKFWLVYEFSSTTTQVV
ncbi:MAG: PKD domain-containing protein, partial [Salinivirgaceae bacterium]|nr:PKD domain-containing protein [Salinivirgaceae bacterium]